MGALLAVVFALLAFGGEASAAPSMHGGGCPHTVASAGAQADPTAVEAAALADIGACIAHCLAALEIGPALVAARIPEAKTTVHAAPILFFGRAETATPHAPRKDRRLLRPPDPLSSGRKRAIYFSTARLRL